MKNINILLSTILFIIFLNSCRTKQLVTNTLITTLHDTIRDYKVITRFKPIHDTLTIDNPCDSLGILKQFYASLTIPSGRVKIVSYNGSIKATIDVDSIANVYDSKYRAKYNNKVKFFEKVVIKNVIPTWALITIFFESIIIIGYLYFRFINPFK
jgi:hypothetical protein